MLFLFHIPEFLLVLRHERVARNIETARFAGGPGRHAASRDAGGTGGECWRAEANDASLARLPRNGRPAAANARRPPVRTCAPRLATGVLDPQQPTGCSDTA